MSNCPGFDGICLVTRQESGAPRWDRADPGIHVAAALADHPVLLARYEVAGECPHQPEVHHARLRPGTEPVPPLYG